MRHSRQGTAPRVTPGAAQLEGSAGQPALLIIDVQRGFEDPQWGPRNNPLAEQTMARLLAAWRDAGATIVHVRHDSAEAQSPLRPGQPGNQFKPEVAPRRDEMMIAKTVNNAFIGTGLERLLRQRRLAELVIAGLTTNHCVSTTARMAGNLGFATFVVSDGTATFDRLALDGTIRPAEEVHAAALSDLNEEFATVITADRAIETLLARRPIEPGKRSTG
jgi:nicotinamidase-related amidase